MHNVKNTIHALSSNILYLLEEKKMIKPIAFGQLDADAPVQVVPDQLQLDQATARQELER